MSKLVNKLIPRKFLWRLSILNIAVISFFVILSSLAIYNTACFLVDEMVAMNTQQQSRFNVTLFNYLLVFSIATIIVSSLIHFYLTRRMIRPVRDLIESTKTMKQGSYPAPIEVKSDDETGELVGHFNELVQQLKNNETLRQKLVADLSHEFRTPLSNLNGYLDALSKGVIDGDKKLYQSLLEESRRLTEMVEQLELLKEWDYVSNQAFSAKEPVDIRDLIEQSAAMSHWNIKNAGIESHLNVSSRSVNVNPSGISQVIGNLIENAVRYHQGTGPISIFGEVEGKSYKISVAGMGKTIPAKETDNIFERFYRVEHSRSRETGGAGLGLAISKEIIDHHNGEIGLESDGSYHTFWFTLPLFDK